MRDAAQTLTALRGAIARFETQPQVRTDAVNALGHAGADAALQGGLKTGTLHEVFAAEDRHSVPAMGFAAGLTMRIPGRRPVLWIRQDFAAARIGELSMTGLSDLGLHPGRILVMRSPDADGGLRAALEGLSCGALGAVVLELWGNSRAVDLVASRRLTLAAAQSGVTNILLRFAAETRPSTAETRWVIRSAASPSRVDDWGMPLLDSSLVRNRRGPIGRWLMEWNGDECLFREPAHPRALAAKPLRRSVPATLPARWNEHRRAG
jgi:protein ImuA